MCRSENWSKTVINRSDPRPLLFSAAAEEPLSIFIRHTQTQSYGWRVPPLIGTESKKGFLPEPKGFFYVSFAIFGYTFYSATVERRSFTTRKNLIYFLCCYSFRQTTRKYYSRTHIPRDTEGSSCLLSVLIQR